MTLTADSRLLDHPVFDGVEGDRLASLLATIRPHRVDAGTIVERPDSHCCTLLLEGRLHTYVIVPDGRRLLLEIVESGGIEGMLDVIAGQEGHFVEAVKPSIVAVLRRDDIRQLVNGEPRVAVNLLHLSLERLDRRERHLEAATHHEATRRVAAILLQLTRYLVPWAQRRTRFVELRPRPSHVVLADMLGLRRETVTLRLAWLRQVGAVQSRRDHLVLDQVLLRAVLEGEAPRRMLPGGAPRDGEAAARSEPLVHQQPAPTA